MWTVHATRLLVPAAAALTLAACAGAPKAETPAGVSLAGNWRLDHPASDDPQKVIDKMHVQAQKILRRQGMMQDVAGPRGGAGSQGGTQAPDVNPALGGDDSGPGGGPRDGPRPDLLRYSPMMHVLTRVIARGDYLTVRQSTDEFVLDYGTTRRSYTPGARSVVSSETGVADQTSGWDGRAYLINIRAQIGPNVVERFALSPDGAHLIDKVRIGPGELPAVELTRVYDRSTEAAPRTPPTSD